MMRGELVGGSGKNPPELSVLGSGSALWALANVREHESSCCFCSEQNVSGARYVELGITELKAFEMRPGIFAWGTRNESRDFTKNESRDLERVITDSREELHLHNAFG
jgi:hypothetical protein